MKQTKTIKTLFVTLTAALGIAFGATALVSTAQASNVQLHPPADNSAN